jgi:endonuclease/exonuclease/phosphatase family metal-dependent hydrolase
MHRTALLLALVGLVLLASAPTQSRGAPPTEGVLRVLSYNVHGLPSFITGDDTLGRQRAIAPLLEPFDVIGLQEDFMDEGHDLLAAHAPHPTQRRFSEALEGRVYGSGLAVLAGPRAVHSSAEHFETFHGTLDAGNDGLASKGFLVVRLELAPGVEVDVYDSHMDAGGSRGDQEARAEQAAHITRAMQDLSGGRAVLFLGDTNLSAGRRGRDAETLGGWLSEADLRCACLASRETCCQRIDRVLYRSGIGVELSVERWGVAPGFVDQAGDRLSDHDPILAEVRWRRRPL